MAMMIGTSIVSAQQSVTVNNSSSEINPIVKRYGTNLPASTSFDLLKAHAADLKELGIQYVRLSAGWGQEGSGLYDSKQVTVSGDDVTMDFTRVDEIVDILTKAGSQTHFVLRTPQDFGALNSAPTGTAWYNLNKQFAKHWTDKGLARPTYEIMEKIDDSGYFSGDAEAYYQTYIHAAKGIFDGEDHSHIKTNVYPANIDGAMPGSKLDIFKNYIKGGDGHADERNDRMQGLGANASGIDNLIGRYKSFDETRNAGHDWTFSWETIIQEFNAGDKTSAASVDNNAVIQLLQSVRETFFFNDVTRIYMSQLFDTSDGAKGLISADGKKTQLYFALQLLNKMPSDRKKLSGAGDPLWGFASSDATCAAIVLWNEAASGKQTASVNLTDLPFTTGKVKMFSIDATNSADGTLTEKSLGSLSGNSFSASVEVEAKGCVYIFIENGAEVTTLAPMEGFITDHHMYWFKFTEGWASHSFDPETMTIFLLDRNDYPDWGGDDKGDWGVTHTAIEMLGDKTQKLNVKVDQVGTVNSKDENSAIYFRIDYERVFVDEEEDERLVYYGNSTVFYDNLFDGNHGSVPDAYPNGLKENEAVKVNFKDAEGVTVDLSDYAPRDWSGNYRVIAYMQNPGAHATGVQVKMQLRDPEKTITYRPEGAGGGTGIESSWCEERGARSETYFNLLGQRVDSHAKGILIVNGKKYINR